MARKKRTTSVPVFSEELTESLLAIRKKFGKVAVVSGATVAQPQRQRLPTGVFNLDATVGGGIPKGRMTILSGEYSGCKTSLALKACADAQRRCRFCHTRFRYKMTDAKRGTISVIKPCVCGESRPHVVCYLDVEATLDFEYARRLGFRPELALFDQPEYAERGIDIADAIIRSGEADVIVVDSIAQLTPTVESEESAERWQQGLGARLVNKAMRKFSSGLNSLGATTNQKPAVILINQKREKIGVMFGDPSDLPYGRGQKYIAALWIELRPGRSIRMDASGREVRKRGEGVVVGSIMHWTVKKNKLGPGGQSGEFKYFTTDHSEFGLRVGGVNNDEQLLGYGKQFALVNVGGGGNYEYHRVKARGEAAFLDALKKSPKHWRHLRKTVAHHLQASVTGEGDDSD